MEVEAEADVGTEDVGHGREWVPGSCLGCSGAKCFGGGGKGTVGYRTGPVIE